MFMVGTFQTMMDVRMFTKTIGSGKYGESNELLIDWEIVVPLRKNIMR